MKNKYVGKVCVVRSNGAGVFVGDVIAEKKDTVILQNSRRIWYWEGAASLSQLAMEGVAKANQCKFPIIVNEMKIFNVLEIIPITKEAKESIYGVPVWTV